MNSGRNWIGRKPDPTPERFKVDGYDYTLAETAPKPPPSGIRDGFMQGFFLGTLASIVPWAIIAVLVIAKVLHG